MTPRRLYSSLALAEMVTWALLLVGIVLKYSHITAMGVRIAGPIHGLAFLSYGAATLLIWANNRWSFARGVIGLLSTLIPFATLPFEKNTERAGLLAGGWRFRDTSDTPANATDHVLALVVRKPMLAFAAIATVVIVVFFVLLSLGSPLAALRN
ncbi:DUF3817 domain-containing protein [Staphylococcus chromogenes]|nr:DUF3817 domain-containing protein [Staphylococcus chromogenes]